MGVVYALANQKGGVGKTTTTVNLAAWLADAGRRVLVIDVDPQGNATSSLGIDKRTIKRSVYDAMVNNVPLKELFVDTQRANLTLVPAAISLAGAEVELVEREAREGFLARAISSIKDEYDYILLDCPPSLGLLTLNALLAADAVIIPLQCEFLALEGLMQLVNTIRLILQNLDKQLFILGILMTMYDARTNLSGQVVEEVKKHFPGRIFKVIIPRSVRLSEAPSYGQTIAEYDPQSKGGQAYKSLMKEVEERSVALREKLTEPKGKDNAAVQR